MANHPVHRRETTGQIIIYQFSIYYSIDYATKSLSLHDIFSR